MYHRHTIGFRRLREERADQKQITLNRKLEIDGLQKDIEVEMKKLLDEKASWEQKILDAQSQRDSIKRQYDSSKGKSSQARERIIQD